ncbi:hypothetical protein PVAP13_3KG283127, partial [Panicum virgatum]
NKFQYLFLPLSFSARSICCACLVLVPAASHASGTSRVEPRAGRGPARFTLCCPAPVDVFDPVVVVLYRGLPSACRDGAEAAAYHAESERASSWVVGPAAGRVWILRTPSPAAGVATPRRAPP